MSKNNMENLKVVVPARLGSKRVKIKNLRYLNGKPLISHIINTLKKTSFANDVYINSDSLLFSRVAKSMGVKFYHRDPKLATSASLIDDWIFDFIDKESPSHLAVVNPTSPFIDVNQLDKAIEQYATSDCDTLLSCERIQTHCFLNGLPINFSTNGQHPRSQDLTPVQALNFAITIWDCNKFKENYLANGYGVYTGKIGFFETEGWACIDIDYPEDFNLAEIICRFINKGETFPEIFPEYVNEFLVDHKDVEN
jgi:CMP-N,N'-diacetyllegionaminic acid synthase